MPDEHRNTHVYCMFPVDASDLPEGISPNDYFRVMLMQSENVIYELDKRARGEGGIGVNVTHMKWMYRAAEDHGDAGAVPARMVVVTPIIWRVEDGSTPSSTVG